MRTRRRSLKFFFIPTTKKSINQLSNFDFPRKQFVKPFFFFYRLVRKTLYTHLSRPFTNFTSIDQLRDTRQRIVESRLIVRLKSATRVEKQRVACDFSSPTAMKRLGCQRQVCVSSDLNLPVYSGFDQPKRGWVWLVPPLPPPHAMMHERGAPSDTWQPTLSWQLIFLIIRKRQGDRYDTRREILCRGWSWAERIHLDNIARRLDIMDPLWGWNTRRMGDVYLACSFWKGASLGEEMLESVRDT